MPKKIDEANLMQAKEEFIFGIYDEVKEHRHYPSLSELADKYGFGKNTIYTHARNEGWQEDKNKHHQRMERERNEQRANMMVAEAERLDTNSIKVSQGAIIAAGKLIQKAATGGLGYENGQVSPADFQRAVSAAALAQRMGKLALGEAQFISKVTTDADVPEPLREILTELDELAKAKSSSARHTLQ